jgi:hypothetical protein
MSETASRARVVFAALGATAALAVVGVFYWAKERNAHAPSPLASPAVHQFTPLGDSSSPTRLYYRHTGIGPHFGMLARVDLGTDAAPTIVDGLSCEAVHVGGNRGLCLSADRGVVTTYLAKLFDADTYEVLASFPLAGVPSRTRVAANAQVGATTVFVTGHGYDSVDFSTQTLLIDIPRAEVVADLETFSVFERGTAIANADFNFWGVTFTPDSETFYATLSTAGRHVLVKGDIAARRAEVVYENVECPSLSPDGTRVAYKKRLVENNRISWQLHVLDLDSLIETPLAERRSIDDQLEWLDNGHVLYSVAAAGADSAATTEVWLAAADGTGTPSPFLRTAYSPAAVR